MKNQITISIFVILLTCLLGSCAGVKPYEKEYLLSPLMDDAAVSELKPDLSRGVLSQYERLSLMAGQGGSQASSCPTCGG